MSRLSVVIPFLNERDNLPVLRQRLENVFASFGGVEPEVVLVDDGSDDGSEQYARQWARDDARVNYVRLSRNFGSHMAASAGLDCCRGDCCVLLAADLQDPPELIGSLYQEWLKGHDVVWAARSECRGQGWWSKLTSRLYYWTMARFSLREMAPRGADFLLLDRKVIEAHKGSKEKNTSLLGLIHWLGFRQSSIQYVKEERHAGRSKWGTWKKIKLFVDSMVSFSYAPIRLMSAMGALISLAGFIYAGVVFLNVLDGNPVPGWTSLMMTTLLLNGFSLLMLGVLGEYLWRTLDEARGRPRYVIQEIVSHGADAAAMGPPEKDLAA